MNRRQALLGLVAGFASVAGCTQTSTVGSSSNDTESQTNDETERPRTTAPMADGPIDYPGLLVRSQYDQAQAVLVIGNRSDPRSPYREAKPHEVLVWNDANATWTIAIEFTDRREQYDLKSDGYLRIQVAKPGDMTVSIPSGGNSTAKTIRVRSDLVDCNDSQTDIAVRENGSMETKEISTSMGCATATANDPS